MWEDLKDELKDEILFDVKNNLIAFLVVSPLLALAGLLYWFVSTVLN